SQQLPIGDDDQIPAFLSAKEARDLALLLPIDVSFRHSGVGQEVSADSREAVEMLSARHRRAQPRVFLSTFHALILVLPLAGQPKQLDRLTDAVLKIVWHVA